MPSSSPLVTALLTVAFVATACGGGGGGTPPLIAAPTFPSFVDVKETAHVSAAHHSITSLFQTGQAWGDYDRDGWLDLYVTDQNGPNHLFHNKGDGTFEPSPLQSEVALPSSMSGGAVFADVDNDGWSDLLVLNQEGNVLFHNDGGQHFVDVTSAAGIGTGGTGMTASLGDYDNDGWLDLYVANWACANCRDFLEAMRDRLFHNDGDGTFTDVTALLGSNLTIGYGYAAGFLDFDDDGDLDIYLVNDKGGPGVPPANTPMNRNVLWRNDGAGTSGWVFTEIAIAAGADSRIDGMGIAVGDFDGDHHLDIAASNHGRPVLLHNQGNGTFADVAAVAGVPVLPTTWGLFFADLNNDGRPDLYIAGSDPVSCTLENVGAAGFRDVAAISNTDDPLYTMGAACADYDGDGWLDFVVGNWGTAYRLNRNLGLAGEHHWFRARLEGRGAVNRDAVGTRVLVTDTLGRTQMQEVMCGSSLGAGNDLALHFGLGTAQVTEVTVRWPDGVVEHFATLPTDLEWRHRHP